VAAHREGPSRVELAGALEEAAVALIAAGDAAGAKPLLRDAVEIWEPAGAAHDVGRLTARLRELGERPGGRARPRRAERGWRALTESEQRIVGLVREGLTYREIGERLFISRRTVESHVSRAFVKLNVHSRAELAALPECDAHGLT
jgi:DNA-binding CsgD family transcriptional regulator